MENLQEKISSLNQLISNAFVHFDVATENKIKVEETQKKGGKNLPQAVGYGLLSFAITLIILQLLFLIMEAITSKNLSDYTFLANILPLAVGTFVYFYWNRKNSKNADYYNQIAENENALGRKIMMDNIDTIKLIPSTYWYPLATEYLDSHFSSNENLSIAQVLADYDKMIQDTYKDNSDDKLIKEYERQTLQVFIIQRHEVFEDYV